MVSAAQPVLPPIDSPPPIHIPALASLPAPDAPHHPSRPPRQAHSNVLARLQALFPSHPSPPSPQPFHPSPAPPPLPPKPLPRFIKVRILTWNMHDSLPKGDCHDLLGSVPPFVPSPSPQHLPPTLPTFSLTPDHPYHFVIVAGQECPSASGIPMALGAGFKLKDNSRSRHSLLPDPDDPPPRKSAELDLSLPLDKANEHYHPPSSWSSILENWYSHPSPPPSTSSDPNDLPQAESPQIGPYELLIKERMMGLYLAVFIHREARPFVRGMSKSAVTAGLIGGRVGNKGGVGVSVNLDGTTLLFINAHLAAHEGKVNHRLADLAKIKVELAVDDFLAPSDPRFMAEDITDRFDGAFIFGDLNFRLDLTRLHADWLISRKEYEQALEFDQLRKVMATGDSFEGFNEAPIRFPPTFKYDVLRTLSRRSRYKSFRRTPATPTIPSPHGKVLSEVTEHEKEPITSPDDQVNQASHQERDLEDDGEPDAMSVASSAWMSVRSRRTIDHDDDDNDEDDDNEIEDDQELASSGDIAQSPPASASASNLVHKMWSATAAHKAKGKWVSLFSANSPKSSSPRNKSSKWRQSWTSSKSPTSLRRGSHITPAENSSTPQTPIDPEDPRQMKAGRVKEFQTALLDAVHARPHKHLALSENNVDLEDEDKGVYDSSHKQRVPSWCDRILWKSTIMLELDQDSEDADSARFMPLRAKMGQIFNALKPSSMRSRRDSTWSINHPDLAQQATPTAGNGRDILVQPLSIEKRVPIPPRASASMYPKPQLHRQLSQARSMDSFKRPSGEGRTSLTRVLSLEPSSTPAMQIPPTRETSPTLFSTSFTTSSPLDLTEPTPTPPSTSAPVFRWLLPFLYKDISRQGAPPSSAPPVAGSPPPPPPPRRGDITCLMYDTLDDKGMRRLEGRSDHRPVIGSYALYI